MSPLVDTSVWSLALRKTELTDEDNRSPQHVEHPALHPAGAIAYRPVSLWMGRVVP